MVVNDETIQEALDYLSPLISEKVQELNKLNDLKNRFSVIQIITTDTPTLNEENKIVKTVPNPNNLSEANNILVRQMCYDDYISELNIIKG